MGAALSWTTPSSTGKSPVIPPDAQAAERPRAILKNSVAIALSPHLERMDTALSTHALLSIN